LLACPTCRAFSAIRDGLVAIFHLRIWYRCWYFVSQCLFITPNQQHQQQQQQQQLSASNTNSRRRTNDEQQVQTPERTRCTATCGLCYVREITSCRGSWFDYSTSSPAYAALPLLLHPFSLRPFSSNSLYPTATRINNPDCVTLMVLHWLGTFIMASCSECNRSTVALQGRNAELTRLVPTWLWLIYPGRCRPRTHVDGRAKSLINCTPYISFKVQQHRPTLLQY